MHHLAPTAPALYALFALFVLSAGCDAGAADPGVTAPFACGALATCEGDQACAGRGQGACVGVEPDEHGACQPNCAPTSCGGGVTCLCDTYWCVDLPSHCTRCACAPKPDASCLCDDSDGHVRFACAGA